MTPRRGRPAPTRGRSHLVGNGQVGTGEHAHAWALELRDAVEQNPLPVVVADPGTVHGRRLVEALGATIEPA